MKISFNPYIQKTINLHRNEQNKNTTLSSDVFVKSPSFCSIYDEKSFSQFDSCAKGNSFKFHARDIIDDPENYYGRDSEGQIYKIPDCDKWIIKKHKDEKLMPMQVKETTYTEIDDVSPRINIGQPIASLRVPYSPRITEHYYIHKAQNGGALGLQRGLMRNISSGTVGKHIESLAQVAKLNQSTINSLVKDVQLLSSMGYKFNGKEPNNLILDTAEKKINLSGLTSDNGKKVAQFSEVLYALLGADFAQNFEKSHRPDVEKQKAREYSDAICAKFFLAMRDCQCKFEVTDNFKELVTSSVFTRVLQTDDNKEKLLRLRSADLI